MGIMYIVKLELFHNKQSVNLFVTRDIERFAVDNFREAYAIASEKIGPLSTEYDKKGEC